MPLERHVVAFEEAVEVTASLDVGAMWDRMLGEFLGEWTRLDRQNLSAAELSAEMEVFMGNLSGKPEEALARQSSGVSYNQGRAAEIQTASTEAGVEAVVRSEILDNNTCTTCSQLDGIVIEVGSPDFDRYMPPAFCDGGDNCRGFYVAIGPGGAA